MAISNDRKAVIHVARQQLHMADEDYRALLQRAAGVRSSVDLDDDGFVAVMAEFERLGFRNVGRHARAPRVEGMATPVQVGRIRALWKGYTGVDDDMALARWIERHLHVSHLRFLDSWKAGKAIAILTKMNSHPNAKKPVGRKQREKKGPAEGKADS